MDAREKYIRRSLLGFPDGFVDCVIRTFRQIRRMQGYGEALPVSVMLYIAAKKYNLSAKICMGLLKVQERDVYSAWCKVDNVIIDPAVFGLTNYYNDFVSRHSFLLKQNVVQFLPMTVPFIGTENAAILQNLVYREGEFDEDWDGADIKWQYGTFVATYLANAPQNCIMERLAEVLDEKYSQLFAEEVLNLAQLDRIGIKGGGKPEM